MLRAGLVGLGSQGIKDHLPALLSSKDVKLVGACDRDSHRASLFTDFPEVQYFSDVSEMLGKCPLDLLIVCVPHDQYPAVLHAAAQAGVHVLKEKPFARTVDEALLFGELFTSKGLCLITHTQRRHASTYRHLKARLPSLGRIIWSEFRYTLNADLASPGWRNSRSISGGGCVIDMGYHMIDLLVWYLGVPKHVHAVLGQASTSLAGGEVEDSAQLLFSFNDGSLGSCLLSRYLPPKQELLRISGENGTLEVSQGQLIERNKDGSLRAVYAKETPANHVDAAALVLRDRSCYEDITWSHLPHLAIIDSCYEASASCNAVQPTARIIKGEIVSNGIARTQWRTTLHPKAGAAL